MLRRIREATDEPIILMKGLAAAERWPGTRLRPWTDMDLFVRDGEAVQAALLRAGFVEVGEPEDYDDSHHLRPVAYPGFPFAVEIHRRPKWPNDRPPSFDEVLEAAARLFRCRMSSRHRPLTTRYSSPVTRRRMTRWAHRPFGRHRRNDPRGRRRSRPSVSRAWGVSRLWAATAWSLDRLLLSPQSSTTRRPIWHRHLYEARERTVFEGHVERLAGPKAASTPAAAPLACSRGPCPRSSALARRALGFESSNARALSLRHASVRESEHKEALFGPRRG